MSAGTEDVVAPTTSGRLRYWADVSPDHPALRWADGQLTYAELDARSDQVAQALLARGIGRGDRVCFIDKNSPEQVELSFGAAKIAAVPTPVNFRLAPPEIAYIVADAGARVFFVGSELLSQVEAVEGELGGAEVIVIGGAGDDARPSYAAWRDAFPPDDPGIEIDSQDIAYQLYSSGTTGRPKGVLLTHANLSTGQGKFRALIELGQDGVSMVAMPLFHIGGGGWLLAGLAHGATCVLVRDVVPADIVDTIEREGVTHVFVVPAVLQFMLAVPGVGERDFSALRYITYGASPISERVLAEAIGTFGCRFVQLYGLTETTGAVVYLPAEDHDPDGPRKHRLRAAGLPLAGVELRVVDPATGTDAAPGAVGEVWIRGPLVMQGYWHLPEATAESITPEGWFRSGDIGYLDGDGYLYLYDRVKDMIVSGAENVYPAEVENVLMAHPAVADAAVFGVPHERWGESPLAVVVRRAEAAPVTGEDLIAWCRERLAGFKCPTRVEWAETLPRNPSGKILKKDLRAPYWEGRDRFVG